MEGRVEALCIAVLGVLGTVACSSGNSAGNDGGAQAALDASAPDAASAAPSLRFFTGVLDGTDARVGVVAAVHHARVYFCGGKSSYTDLSRWLPGGLDGAGSFSADETAAMGWAVHATVGTDDVTGTLATGDGGVRNFHAAPVDGRTMAGLYEGVSPCGKVGLIVSQASPDETPVSLGACIGNGSTDIHQVNPVGPLVFSPDGTIGVAVSGTTETLALTPAVVAD
ncbi:MAG TPA: hypothetical protein VH062_34390 [Polyangiaceae bacterium]|jgi:hypothetical protein|nr:hypothetical protein [Polyangiaceae bacterium]